MRIVSRAKLIPFSNALGAAVLIPKTHWMVRVYPARLEFQNLKGGDERAVGLPIKGPMKRFRVACDLERGRIEVEGVGANGFFRYWIEDGMIHFRKGETIDLPFLTIEDLKPKTRLFMGVHKKSQWERVAERRDWAEIFPFWFSLAQWVPKVEVPKKAVGAMRLLSMEQMDALFQVGFHGVLVPTLVDMTHSGILPEEKIPKGVSPLVILQEGARLIRSLFFTEAKGEIALLPQLPKELHAGKILQLETEEGHLIDMEWSKKKVKKVIITPSCDGKLRLELSKGLKQFRLNGVVHKASTPIVLCTHKNLYLDRFM